jgi:hypothetical protein
MATLYTPQMGRQGSYGAAIQAYMPMYAPPSVPIPEMLVTRSPITSIIPGNSRTPVSGAPVVNRKNRIQGMRYLFSRGAKYIRQFRMIATGQVESTRFQPATAWTWDGSFNDALFQFGYPGYNLGLSEKVPTIPAAALGVSNFQMLPKPQYTRTIFTQRSYGARPGLPAQPRNGA